MKRRRHLQVERLDSRVLPAVYGVPWGDSRHLTLSFAPDGTPVAAHASNLFATLDAQMPRAVWQAEILRAVQAWAAVTNISVGVTADSGLAFGTPGLGESDPRFGDIRIGGQLMDQSVLSISVPHDPFLSGTWSGDVLVNSSFNFTQLHTNLFSVALHEFGHVFGLPHSVDPNSVMFDHGAHVYGGLSAADVTAIRALYGARLPDGNEGSSGNDTPDDATHLRTEDGTRPGIAFGDLTTPQDVDYFRVDVPDAYSGPATFRIQTAEISLLAPRMTLLDDNGNVILRTKSANVTGSALRIALRSTPPGQRYYLRVERASPDSFGIGRYGLAVTFDGLVNVTEDKIDSVLRGPFDSLSPSEIDKLFDPPEEPPYLNDDGGADDNIAGAIRLEPTEGGVGVTHFGTLASLATTADVDYYRLRAEFNATQVNVLTATVTGLLGTAVAPRISLFDEDGAPVPFQLLANGNGTFTIQATSLTEHDDYYLRVSANPSAPLAGNYSLTIDLGGQPVELQTFASGSLSSGTTAAHQTLYVARPQLFQFILSATATGSAAGTPIVATIADEHGTVIMTLSGRAGDTVSGPSVLLAPGEYTVRYRTKGRAAAGSIDFTLRGLALSDPIGPVRGDTTLQPRYVNPNNPNGYLYPNGIATLEVFLWTGLLFG